MTVIRTRMDLSWCEQIPGTVYLFKMLSVEADKRGYYAACIDQEIVWPAQFKLRSGKSPNCW
jgi:hypothetical protein